MNYLSDELEAKGLEGRLLNTLIYLNIEWSKADDEMKLSQIINDLGQFYDSPDGTICEEKYAMYKKLYLEDSMKLGRRDKKSETGFEEGSREDYKNRMRQYRILKNAVENNERLANMTIGNQSWNMGDKFNDRKGLNACTFEDENGNIIVVYRGTASGEWGDNSKGLIGLVNETRQQKQAMEYFDYIVEKNNYHKKNIEITITGHSKGGNKAQYTTINSKYRDLIKYCFSYDGQGFSPEAIEAFEKRFDDYNESLKKLYSFNGENDFVNPLGIYIIPDENRFYFKTVIPSEIPLNINSPKDVLEFIKNITGISDVKKLHFPDSCLTENGEFAMQVEQGYLSLFVENFARQALELPPEYRDKIFSTIMSFMQGDNETVDGESVASWSDKLATLLSIPLLADMASEASLDMIREKHGVIAEFLAANALLGICPGLFSDDVIRIGFRNNKNAALKALESLKKLGNFILEKSKEFGRILIDYGQSLGRAFCKFILEARAAFDRMIIYVGHIIDDVIDASKNVIENVVKKIEDFKNKLNTVVTNFFNNLKDGIDKFASFCKNTVKNAWNSAVEKVTNGVNNLINNGKNIIRKGYEGLKTGVNKVVNLGNMVKTTTVNFANRAATECIRGIGLVVDKIKEAGTKIEEFRVNLKETFLRFVSEAEKALVRLKDYVLGIANNIKDAVHTGIKAMEDFKNKAERAISSFIASVVNGIKNFAKYCKKEVANAWNKVTKKASQKVEEVTDNIREQIKTMREKFEGAVKYVIDYKKETVKSIRDKKEHVLKTLRNSVIRTIGVTYIKNLKVDLARLEDLRKKMKDLEREWGEKIHYMLKDVNNLTSDTERKYNEYYVRQRIREINRICDNIKADTRRITDMIERKTKALDNACVEYKRIEAMAGREANSFA